MMYTIIASIILFYSLYMLLTVGIGLLYTSPELKADVTKHSVLVFYPMYKPTERAVENLLKQKKELHEVDARLFVLAQDADADIDEKLKTMADYFRSERFSHLDGNSYHHALEYAVKEIDDFDTKFDSILLMDPDNYMNTNSLRRLIQSRISGSGVALSRRESYSKDTSTSLFDGMSERLNDYMFRRSKSLLGFHPELSGSGMLMKTDLFTEAVLQLDKKSPGMDKQLLIRMMFAKFDLEISYDEKAVVLDEKTEDAGAFNRQRMRWFGNQYYNAWKFGWKLITSNKSALVDYGISLWRPPRSFQLVGSVLFIPFDLLAFNLGWIHAPIMTISALLSVAAVGLFLLNEGMLSKVVVKSIPLIWTSLKNGYTALKGSFNSKGSFIHTRVNK